MEIKKILVTGATGFIGKYLIRFLKSHPDNQIWAISLKGGKVGEQTVDAVDITEKIALHQWRKGKPNFDAIFHLAAVIPSSFDSIKARNSFTANIKIISNLLDLTNHNTIFIYASGTSVYGIPTNIPVTEDALPSPDNYYSLGKYVCELICAIESSKKGFTAISLRISAPYGPGQQARTVINTFLDSVLDSRDLLFYGSGERMQDFTYIDDIIRAIWLAYQKKVSGIYNIASGRSVSMKELAEIVKSLHPTSRSRVQPAGIPDPQENYRGVFSIEKAKRVLGYNPQITLEQGLKSCLQARIGHAS